MKRHVLLLVVILGCIFNAAGAAAPDQKPENEFERLMTYYRKPAPEKLSAVLRELDATPVRREAFSPLLGFFYEVFRANPGHIPEWLKIVSEFRQPAVRRALESVAVIAVPGSRMFVAEVPDKLPSPEEFERMTAADPDFSWGRFFATGDAKHVDAVLRCALTAKNKGDTIDLMAYAARWSLFSLSRQQPEVEKIFRELLTKCSDDEVKFLFDSVEVPERERLLGNERAAKLPPPVGSRKDE